MAAHRYWSVYCLSNHGDGTVGIDEIDMRVNAAGSRLSITGNGTPFASSTYPGIYAAAGAFDNVPFTANPSSHGWISGSPGTGASFPHRIGWDFGSGNEQDINYVAITNLNLADSAATASPKYMVLQWSDVGTSGPWTSHIFAVEHPNGTGQTVAYEYAPIEAKPTNRYPFAFFSVITGEEITAALVKITRIFRDFEFGGNGSISGTVKIDGDPTDLPVRRRLRLYRDRDGLLIRQTWSDPATGAYLFDGIDERYRYTIIAYDYQHSYRAVLADNVTPDT